MLGVLSNFTFALFFGFKDSKASFFGFQATKASTCFFP